MEDKSWILLDTETTGFKKPIFVVELAAQRMKGWEPDGKPFRFLINQNTEIPSEAARVHGYTREILERDGILPDEVYEKFSKYVGGRPIVAYNLSYDWDKVLVPEWERLGIDTIGKPGFCAYQLTQRLLDPVPAGNCKLQTLRQYYRLPERGAHTGIGDVETVIDLLQNVLKPIALERGLLTWESIVAYAENEWFPSRIPFGKHKGRNYRDASGDADLKSWLEWLCSTSNKRSNAMGEWYLGQLGESDVSNNARKTKPFPNIKKNSAKDSKNNAAERTDLISFVNLKSEEYEQLIMFARARLADLSTEYIELNREIDVHNLALFNLVKEYYHERDRLVLLIEYRQHFLEKLMLEGEDEAEEIINEYSSAHEEQEQEFKEASRQQTETSNLTENEKKQIKKLFGKLVKLFHPDRYRDEPEKQIIYEKLITVINEARDHSDIELLLEISEDPDAFIAKQGWEEIGIRDGVNAANLRKLYEEIELEIVSRIEALNLLRNTSDYHLLMYCRNNPDRLIEVSQQRIEVLNKQIRDYKVDSERLKNEIEEITGEALPDRLQ